MNLKVNGKSMECAKGISIAQLLESMNLNAKAVVAECNGVIIPQEQFSSVNLEEGDILELLHFVGGG